MEEFEIMFDDLKPEIQQEFAEFCGFQSVEEAVKENNWDTFPIVEIPKPEK